jgi:CHAT domain
MARSELGTVGLAREVVALRGLDAMAWYGSERCTEALGLALDKVAGATAPLPFNHARAHILIKGKHLLIVPLGPLTQLPFQVLVTKPPTSGDHRAAAWLAREHTITVLHAGSSLKALRRVGKPSNAPRPMIGFGNPLLDGPDASYANRANPAREKQWCPDGRSQRMAALAGLRGSAVGVETRSGVADALLIRKQVPLPETTDELCAVAHDVKAEPRDIRLGAQATERDFKQLSASGELAKYRMCTLRPMVCSPDS